MPRDVPFGYDMCVPRPGWEYVVYFVLSAVELLGAWDERPALTCGTQKTPLGSHGHSVVVCEGGVEKNRFMSAKLCSC